MDMIEVRIKDLYSFLISNCRYGYTRNNHLMPSCAFDEAIIYLHLMKKKNAEYASYTAKQLCEECIDYLLKLQNDWIKLSFDKTILINNALKFIRDLIIFIKETDRPRIFEWYDNFIDIINKKEN